MENNELTLKNNELTLKNNELTLKNNELLDLKILEEKGKELLLKDETIELAKDFATKYFEKTNHKLTKYKMSAFLYIASIRKNFQYVGERRTQEEISHVFGISSSSVFKWYRDIYNTIDCEIPMEVITKNHM